MHWGVLVFASFIELRILVFFCFSFKESEQKINKSYPKMVEFHTSPFYL